MFLCIRCRENVFSELLPNNDMEDTETGDFVSLATAVSSGSIIPDFGC
jgi:hypothetical protein